jgi:hypothetical protein
MNAQAKAGTPLWYYRHDLLGVRFQVAADDNV